MATLATTTAEKTTAEKTAADKKPVMDEKPQAKQQRARVDDRCKVFCGTANEALCDDVCNFLGLPRGQALVTRFKDGEAYVQIQIASVRVDLQDLKRPVLAIDSGKDSALSGQPVILMGYATGLAAILARTDEESAQDILKKSGNDVSQVLNELATGN